MFHRHMFQFYTSSLLLCALIPAHLLSQTKLTQLTGTLFQCIIEFIADVANGLLTSHQSLCGCWNLIIFFLFQEHTHKSSENPHSEQDCAQSVSPTILLLMSHSFLAACSSVALAISSSSLQLAKHFPDTPSTSGEQAR